MTNNLKPNCYECIYRSNIPGNAHSQCNNYNAEVKGHSTGIKNGWFLHPFNFDPTWLISCNGFKNLDKSKDLNK